MRNSHIYKNAGEKRIGETAKNTLTNTSGGGSPQWQSGKTSVFHFFHSFQPNKRVHTDEIQFVLKKGNEKGEKHPIHEERRSGFDWR